jgi:hypothetical protein
MNMRALLIGGCLLLAACVTESPPPPEAVEDASKTIDSLADNGGMDTIASHKLLPTPPKPSRPSVAEKNMDNKKVSSPFYRLAHCAAWDYDSHNDGSLCCDELLPYFKIYYNKFLQEAPDKAVELLSDPYIVSCKKYEKWARILDAIEAGE